MFVCFSNNKIIPQFFTNFHAKYTLFPDTEKAADTSGIAPMSRPLPALWCYYIKVDKMKRTLYYIVRHQRRYFISNKQNYYDEEFKRTLVELPMGGKLRTM